MKGLKIYAVKKGHIPGVYEKWTDCSKQITGYKKPIFKKCSTMAEAEMFIKDKSLDIEQDVNCSICEYMMEVTDETMNCIKCHVNCFHSTCILVKSNFTEEEEQFFRKTLICDGCAYVEKDKKNKQIIQPMHNLENEAVNDMSMGTENFNYLLEILLEEEKYKEKKLIKGKKILINERNGRGLEMNTTNTPLSENKLKRDSEIKLKSPLNEDKKKLEDYFIQDNYIKRRWFNSLHLQDKILSLKKQIDKNEKLMSVIKADLDYIKSMFSNNENCKSQKLDKWSQTNSISYSDTSKDIVILNEDISMENRKKTTGSAFISNTGSMEFFIPKEEEQRVNASRNNRDVKHNDSIHSTLKKSVYYYNSNRRKIKEEFKPIYRYFIGKMNSNDTPESIFMDIKNMF